jgi:phosphate transport system substrate-binding protein
LGKIKQWNDPQIQSLNKDKSLPSADIAVVHRSDGSGTTFVWTSYLSKESPEWTQKIGKAKSVQWPVGIGAPGNEGVTNAIKGSPNTIGYVELNYALTTKTPYAFIENKAGKFIEPSLDSVKSAVTAAQTLPAGNQSWAITDGQKFASKLSYVPLPDEVAKNGQETLKSLTYHGTPVL